MSLDALQVALEDDVLWRTLAELCDIDVRERGQPWFLLSSRRTFTAIAADGSGGIFASVVEDAGVFFVGSEGQAGFVAQTVRQFLELSVAIPYWQDCLKFSAGGDIVEMERSAGLLEDALRERLVGLDQYRALLRARLALRTPAAPLESLLQCLRSSERVINESGGWEHEGLIGKRSSADLRRSQGAA
jgi:hypothetical protein